MIIQPTAVHYLNCKGKAGVIRIFNLIYNSEVAKNMIRLGFVFFLTVISTLSPNIRIAISLYYSMLSIENLYVTEKCFRLILKSEFEIDTVVEMNLIIIESLSSTNAEWRRIKCQFRNQHLVILSTTI